MGADGRVVFEIDADTKAFDAQIASLENKLEKLIQDREILKSGKMFEADKETLIELENEIEKTSNQIVNLRNQQVKMEKTSTKSWGKILNNVKKVGLRMLGLASVYGIVSKASSAYLSKDTELAEKLQSVWVALGSFLAPVIEGISNVLLKAVGYINEFIKALTGVDYIARANAKAIEKQAKATRDLNKANKQTYDFDVVRTQQEASSGDISSVGSGLIEIPELNQAIVDKLKKLAEWLRENEELIKAVGVALVATFGAAAVAKIIGGISTLIGSDTALTGLAGLATLLASIATVVLVKVAVDGVEETAKEVEKLNEDIRQSVINQEENTQSLIKLTNAYWEAEKQQKNNETTDKAFTDTLKLTTQSVREEIEELDKQKKRLWFSKSATENLTNEQKEHIKQLGLVNLNYKRLYDQGKLNDDQKRDYAESLKTEIELTQSLDGKVEGLIEEYNRIDGQTYTSKLELDTSQPEEKISLLERLWNGISGSFSSAWGGLKDAWWSVKDLFSSKTYAAGGIVTQPTRAIIGEAGYPEAVVPMTDDYLSTLAQLIGQYGGAGGNGTTNVYLDGRLIQRQMQNRENEIRFSANK